MPEEMVVGDGAAQLVASLRRLERVVPTEVDDLMKGAVDRHVMPLVRTQTPMRKQNLNGIRTGRLRDNDRSTKGTGRVLVSNRVVYANTAHWGRKRLRGFKNVVRGKFFIWNPAGPGRPQAADDAIADGVQRLMERTVRGA